MATTPHASSPAPKGLSVEEELQYYKAQYEQMEADLQDFQASSRELEQELERDVEASEKRERQLKEKLENLSFEVEEWKVCYLTFRMLRPKTDEHRPSTTKQKAMPTTT
jgi:predicted  nucleic acid-binding Zn-ribbon protein